MRVVLLTIMGHILSSTLFRCPPIIGCVTVSREFAVDWCCVNVKRCSLCRLDRVLNLRSYLLVSMTDLLLTVVSPLQVGFVIL